MSKELDSELEYGSRDMGNGWHTIWLNAPPAKCELVIRHIECPDGNDGFCIWNPSIVLAEDYDASADMRQMQEELEELRKDKARLDWYTENWRELIWDDEPEGWRFPDRVGERGTLRQAIDAAMADSGE